ncbi:MAG: APC family permease [Thermoplasmata archaeon]|jgi:amino acid transporter
MTEASTRKRRSTPDRTLSAYASEAGTLGVLLCWALVFADIGTSVYYTPGILFQRFGTHSALFVDLVFIVFVLLAVKYAEVAIRFPEGGGVVSVASKAFHPIVGLVGGLLILADYFLTAGISATSGVIYLSVLIGPLKLFVIVAAIAALLLLGMLNVIGVATSAEVTAFFAMAAAVTQAAVVIAVIVAFGPARIWADFGEMFSGPHLTPTDAIVGFAGAFLAFSGLESIAQLAPAMRSPRSRVAPRTMFFVVLSLLVTSPLLTLWSTTLLAPGADTNQAISLLGGAAAGPWLQDAVAASGALLLIFACNTALIGSYHVFLALSRMRFLPTFLQRVNRWRGTPHVSIGVATLVPVLVVLLTGASTSSLGDLYAFGLLGAFSVTCVSLDVIRWRERRAPRSPRSSPRTSLPVFVLGVATSVAVVAAWATNLFAKPLATVYGSALVLIGLGVAFLTIRTRARRGQYTVFPYLHRPGHPTVITRTNQGLEPAPVLAFLPSDPAKVADVVRRTLDRAGKGPIVFAFRSETPRTRPPRLLEILDPYADDAMAQAAFQSAEAAARKAGVRARYVYIPADADEDVDDWVRQQLRPEETITE